MTSLPAWTCEQIRDVDRRAVEEYGMSSLVLMENAGRGVTDILCQQRIQGPVLICCGRGNNAGDGLVVARHLDLRGFAVEVACWNDPNAWTGDTAVNAAIAIKGGITVQPYRDVDERWIEQIRGADWIVDALLGTGSRGAPRAPFDSVIREINARTNARVLAIDLPSGLDADTGLANDPTIRADVTCTLVRAKVGFQTATAREVLGEVDVLDIGVPRRLLDEIASTRNRE